MLTGNITSKTTNKYRIITVLKYDTYQLANNPADKLVDKLHAIQLAASNKDKELLKEIKELKKELKDIKGEESPNIPYKEIIDLLNEKSSKSFRYKTAKTKNLIKARLKEGFTYEDFERVIFIKTAEWINTEFDKFLRPETLFGNKFEGYLNQKEISTPTGKHLLPKDIESDWLDSYIKSL